MSRQVYSLDGPVEQVIRNIMVSFTINDTVIVPFKCATVYINLLNNSGECVATETYTMEGWAYDQWGGDDEYLINWIRQQVDAQFNRA